MILIKWQTSILLMYLLLNFVFFTKQSKSILGKKKFSRKKTNSHQNEVFVLGHRNPDTDSIVSALVYASFLRRMQVNGKAYRLGDVNNESKFILEKAGIKEPDMLPSHVAEGTDIALVDHNESILNSILRH